MSPPAGTGKRIAHAGEWLVFLAAGGLLRILPRGVARSAGAALGRFAFDVLRIRRAVAIENVRARLAPQGGEWEAARIARASYEVMARTFVDVLRADRFDDAAIRAAIACDEVARVVQNGEMARGSVLVSGHFGNWELFPIAAARFRTNVGVIAGDQSNAKVGGAIEKARLRAGVRTFSSRTGIREAIRFLRSGGILATLMDQDARRKGIFVDFLGVPASTHTGIVALALREGIPLVPLAIVDEGGPARVVAGPAWRGGDGTTEEAKLRDGAAHFNRFLEEQVRAHPEQYFWAHRRWKTRPGS